MILQSLAIYYDRQQESPDSTIPNPGYSSEPISAALIIDAKGNLVQVMDVRRQSDKKMVSTNMNVPHARLRSGSNAYEYPNFMWDNTGFVLGKDNKGKPQNALRAFEHFKKLHLKLLADVDDEGAQAVIRFLQRWIPDNAVKLRNWNDFCGLNVVFRLDRTREYIHDRPLVKAAWKKCYEDNIKKLELGICLVSGEKKPIPPIHPKIKGVWGANSMGAAIVSFKPEAFKSFGKEQNFNAPVGEESAFAYTTALNYLLRSDSPQRVQIADASTVFWTERDSPMEGLCGMTLDPRDDAADNKELQEFLETVRAGKKPCEYDPDVKFYILGLSPNKSRLSVRFWYVSTVGDIGEKFGQHFRDLRMVRSDKDPEFPGVHRLLLETLHKDKSRQKSKKKISPLLGGVVMQAILKGTAYPQSLLIAIINAIRADQKINYLRAAIVKAVLVRRARILKLNKLEIKMSLDKENAEPAYLTGRLFASLEKLQEEAHEEKLKRTIRDSYYGSASAAPRSVFPVLIKLKNHHLGKLARILHEW